MDTPRQIWEIRYTRVYKKTGERKIVVDNVASNSKPTVAAELRTFNRFCEPGRYRIEPPFTAKPLGHVLQAR